jgi:hypothetical protein
MSASSNSLSAKLCEDRAKECLSLAQQAKSRSHSIMLEHIAGTWYRIADRFPQMTHKYAVGQLVYFHGMFGGAASGQYEIVRALPIERDNRLNYRIKSVAEAFERTVEEHELTTE